MTFETIVGGIVTMDPYNLLMIGNPGVGKSTILNGLIGEVRFHSGISVVKGLTQVLQKENVGKCHIHGHAGYVGS